VDIELLVIPGCPGAEEASELLRVALDDVGLADATFTVGVIETEDAARARGFGGSPAFVVDGADLFQTTGTQGSLACRVYQTPDGLRNVPALQDLLHALKQRVAG
jgi:hypothetical protein